MRAVRVEDEVCLTICLTNAVDKKEEGEPRVPSGVTWPCDWQDDTLYDVYSVMLHRVIYRRGGVEFRGASMVLPRSWDAAL